MRPKTRAIAHSIHSLGSPSGSMCQETIVSPSVAYSRNAGARFEQPAALPMNPSLAGGRWSAVVLLFPATVIAVIC
jgi:hypothetical protein